MGRVGTNAGAPGGEVAIEPVPPTVAAEELNLRGEVCPYTFLKARLALEAISPGRVLRVVVDNAASARDVPRSLAAAGHAVLEVSAASDGTWTILTRRGRS